MLCSALMEKMSGTGEFAPFFNDDRRRTLLRGVFDAYYADAATERVVFDTNRLWTSRTALMKELYPPARIICCVREVGWIIDSLERMLRRNPLQLARIFNFKSGSSIYSRVETLMNSEKGLIGHAWSSLREAWFSENAGQLVVIKYDALVRQPELIMRRLYDEIGEEWFAHDFDHVAYDEPDYDAILGMPGLHKVRGKVEHQKRESCIPPEILAKYSDFNFWLKPEANRRGVTIL